ncbi:unnamed protein product [Camellia sinensis]
MNKVFAAFWYSGILPLFCTTTIPTTTTTTFENHESLSQPQSAKKAKKAGTKAKQQQQNQSFEELQEKLQQLRIEKEQTEELLKAREETLKMKEEELEARGKEREKLQTELKELQKMKEFKPTMNKEKELGKKDKKKKEPKTRRNVLSVVARLMGMDMLSFDTKSVARQEGKKNQKPGTNLHKKEQNKQGSGGHVHCNSNSSRRMEFNSFQHNKDNDPDSQHVHMKLKKPRSQKHPQEEELQKFKKEFEACQAARIRECSKVVELGTMKVVMMLIQLYRLRGSSKQPGASSRNFAELLRCWRQYPAHGVHFKRLLDPILISVGSQELGNSSCWKEYSYEVKHEWCENSYPTEASMKMLISEEMSKGPNTRQNVPSVVARLMGMDMLSFDTKSVARQDGKKNQKPGTNLHKKEQNKKGSGGHVHCNSNSSRQMEFNSFQHNKDKDPDSQHVHMKLKKPRSREHPQEEELQKFKKEFEACQAARIRECSKVVELDRIPSQWLAQEALNKEKVALYSNSRRITASEKPIDFMGHAEKASPCESGLQHHGFREELFPSEQKGSYSSRNRTLIRDFEQPSLINSDQKLDISSAPTRIAILRQLNELDADGPKKTVTEEQPLETEMAELEDEAEAYIRDLLVASGLYDGSSDNVLSRWDPLAKPITNDIFEAVEESYKKMTKDNEGSRRDHKLLLDLLNEALSVVLGPPVTMSRFRKAIGPALLPPRGQKLLDRAWEIVRAHLYPPTDKFHYCINDMVAEDLGFTTWSGLMNDDIDAVGKEMESQITGYLIEEIVKDMQSHNGARLGNLYCDPLMTSVGHKISGRQRWTPTPVQLQILERLFDQGNGTPSKQKIKDITSDLSQHGQISKSNVYHWFQNRRARSKRKQHVAAPNSAESEVETEVESPDEKKTKPEDFQSQHNPAPRAEDLCFQNPEIISGMRSLDSKSNKGEPMFPSNGSSKPERSLGQISFYDSMLSNPRIDHLIGKMGASGSYNPYLREDDYNMTS